MSWTRDGDTIHCSDCDSHFAVGEHCQCDTTTASIPVEVAPEIDTYDDVDPAKRPLLTRRGIRIQLARSTYDLLHQEMTEPEVRKLREARQHLELQLKIIADEQDQADLKEMQRELAEVRAALDGKQGSATRRTSRTAEDDSGGPGAN